jgi:hypothetical protein
VCVCQRPLLGPRPPPPPPGGCFALKKTTVGTYLEIGQQEVETKANFGFPSLYSDFAAAGNANAK